MRSYARFDGAALPGAVGTDEDGRYRVSDGRGGPLSFGPYLSLREGEYTAGFYVRRRSASGFGKLEIDVCSDSGQTIHASQLFRVDELFSTVAGLLKVDFTLQSDARDVEVRCHVPADAIVEIANLVVFRRRLGEWGME